MKHLTQLFAAAVLTLALAFSTFAGHAECPGVVDPPPDPTVTGQTDATVTEAIVIVIADLLSLS